MCKPAEQGGFPASVAGAVVSLSCSYPLREYNAAIPYYGNNMKQNLQGRSVLVTGAAGGLGAEVALSCANKGADLVLLDKNGPGLALVQDRIESDTGRQPIICEMDLAESNAEGYRTLVSILETEASDLGAVVHCAVHFPGLQPLEHCDPEDWLRGLQTNLSAPWYLSVLCLPIMRRAGGGSLVFIRDEKERQGKAFWGSYGVSKAGLDALISQFSQEASESLIRVAGINPGPMRTALRSAAFHAENPHVQAHPNEAASRIASFLNGDPVSDEDLLI
jgi:NAD(P)-dependent dehydrogenase (short-subunit alcohol dehydrogenase family)